MFKRKTDKDLAEWAFNKGKLQERIRIKMLLADLRKQTDINMQRFTVAKDQERDRLHKQIEIDEAAMNMINALVDPPSSWVQEKSAPIDRDD